MLSLLNAQVYFLMNIHYGPKSIVTLSLSSLPQFWRSVPDRDTDPPLALSLTTLHTSYYEILHKIFFYNFAPILLQNNAQDNFHNFAHILLQDIAQDIF